ncbi:MAG: response regulator [Ideonella sp.]|nr:response regulator [Ideonella sp.]
MNAPAASDAPGRILVVDDDRLVLATLSHGLSQAGHEVIDADNGDDAILLARQHRPELALLDIRMEGMTGFDVAAYLRDHLGIPFMFLSAFSDDETAARVRELGAVAYLTKPLDVRRIVPAVADALARQRRAGKPGNAAEASPAARPPIAIDAALPRTALAVGILMHRHSLDRSAAWRRLQQLALRSGRSVEAEAAQLVGAIEALAGTGEPR